MITNPRKISLEHQQRHRLYTKRVQRGFLIALNKQVQHASQYLPDISKFRDAIHTIPIGPYEAALSSCYKSILLPEGQVVLDEIHDSINQKSLFDSSFWRKDWIGRLKDWVTGNSARKVTGATETTKKRLREVLDSTYSDEALSNQDRAALIRKTINDPAYNRARSLLIARTETTTATNLSHSIAADSLSDRLNMVMDKTWIPTSDNRTRDTHEAMLAYPSVGKDESFIVGGEELMYPGDANGSAANICNCRCRVVYQVQRDANGRIVTI